MGKMFLFILGGIGCTVGGLYSIHSDLFWVFFVGAGLCYIGALASFFKAIRDLIRSFVNTHRQVRQSIDDERIRKFHEYGKGDGNGL